MRIISRYGFAVLTVIAALGVRWALDPVLGEHAPMLIFLGAVIVSALIAGLGPAILASLLSIVVGTYFFILPRGSFRSLDLVDQVRLAVFTVESVLISALAYYRIQNFQKVADAQRREAAEAAARAAERGALLERERAARAEVERANHLKDEFLATVSHELRSPIHAIVGWTDLLRNSSNLTPESRDKALETIERNARSQVKLIEDLLDVSRIVSGKLRLDVKPFRLMDVIDDAIENVRPAANARQITVKISNTVTNEVVVADPERIQQIVWNLLSNAVKFTPEGGRVEVNVEQKNSHYEISVKDNGRGIGPEFLPHVFDRFRQAERLSVGPRAGLGLGLAIAKSLVEAHGGDITAHSMVTERERHSRSTFRWPSSSRPFWNMQVCPRFRALAIWDSLSRERRFWSLTMIRTRASWSGSSLKRMEPRFLRRPHQLKHLSISGKTSRTSWSPT